MISVALEEVIAENLLENACELSGPFHFELYTEDDILKQKITIEDRAVIEGQTLVTKYFAVFSIGDEIKDGKQEVRLETSYQIAEGEVVVACTRISHVRKPLEFIDNLIDFYQIGYKLDKP